MIRSNGIKKTTRWKVNITNKGDSKEDNDYQHRNIWVYFIMRFIDGSNIIMRNSIETGGYVKKMLEEINIEKTIRSFLTWENPE